MTKNKVEWLELIIQSVDSTQLTSIEICVTSVNDGDNPLNDDGD